VGACHWTRQSIEYLGVSYHLCICSWCTIWNNLSIINQSRDRKAVPQELPPNHTGGHGSLSRETYDHLGLEKVHTVVGGSMGGMQALQFASRFPDRLENLIALSCTAQTTPGSVAFRRVQRRAIMADPNYNDGNYTKENGPYSGMEVARELGMTCYRSREEFDARFDWEPVGPLEIDSQTFEVESYMAYQAKKFSRIYDPNCYLLLSKAMDVQNLGYGLDNLAAGVGRIKARSLICGVKQDLLIPIQEQRYIRDILLANEVDVDYHEIDSKYGHDAMFQPQMQPLTFAPMVRKFIEHGITDQLSAEHHRYSTL